MEGGLGDALTEGGSLLELSDSPGSGRRAIVACRAAAGWRLPKTWKLIALAAGGLAVSGWLLSRPLAVAASAPRSESVVSLEEVQAPPREALEVPGQGGPSRDRGDQAKMWAEEFLFPILVSVLPIFVCACKQYMNTPDQDGKHIESLADSDSSSSDDEGHQKQRRERPSTMSFVTYFLQWIGFLMIGWYVTDPWELQDKDRNLFLIGGIVLYVAHIFESMCCAKTVKYLSNVISEREFIQHVRNMQELPPIVNFSIQNYHYETRTTTSTDSEGNTTTTQHTERVNTHFAAMDYGVADSLDETLSANQTVAMFHLLNDGKEEAMEDGDIQDYLNSIKPGQMFLLCHFIPKFYPVSMSCRDEYISSRERFYQMNTTDTHQDKMENHTVNSFKERCMVVLSGGQDDSVSRPWWMHRLPFFLCAVFMVSLPYRLYLFSKCELAEWDIMKHFSKLEQGSWPDPVPMKSRRRAHDAAAEVFNNSKREESGEVNPVYVEIIENFEEDEDNDEKIELDEDCPHYWNNQDLSRPFDDKARVTLSELNKFQELLDDTFKNKATRDRKGKMASRFKVTDVMRLEDSRLFKRYLRKRAEMAELPRPKLIKNMPGSGKIKTTDFATDEIWGDEDGEGILTAPGLNEAYLFHGSNPVGALGIGEDGFNMSKVGSNVGTMFGGGAYFGEACSKSDEYSTEDIGGVFPGKFALLVCRVLLGSTFRVTDSNIPAIEAALATGHYQSVLGDREAAVGTYREFVVFDEAQIYPEYVVIYEREFD